jgi:maltooligosyltrehalose trehalohydrolase
MRPIPPTPASGLPASWEAESRGSEAVRTVGWRPSLGAWLDGDGVRFRVWAPEVKSVEVIFERPEAAPLALQRFPDGTFGGLAIGLGAGALYRYRIDGGGQFPDPASRYQPLGVHGPSEVIAPSRFTWTDAAWRGVAREDIVIYELHVGTYTAEGTFAAVIGRLPYLAELGVTAIELMPVADFPGNRNWGYDGVDLFAPARCYGTPDDLRRLVDEAHRLGLAIFLDAVYNHLGPEGNYLDAFSPHYSSTHADNPWGRGFNFDGPSSSMVRAFFVENALHWVHEYHVDGLRLDATHAIQDDSPRHFVAQLTARVHESVHDRQVHIIAEDHRNLAYMVKPEGEGGWGLDGVWADDFHHKVRVSLVGDNEGYYRDYSGSMVNLARTLNQGWHFTGQFSEHLKEHRGTDPAGIPPRRFVFCLQNHDQVGNRALGERLHHQIDLAAYRAATVLMLFAPTTPLLFMGQEWAASTPFLYFTDHPEELGRLVTEGRRAEFRHFSAFSDPDARERIPDPQAESTFLASKLNWADCEREPHVSLLRLYRRLLKLRRTEPALRCERSEAFALGESTLLVRQDPEVGSSLLAVIQMHDSSEIELGGIPTLAELDTSHYSLVLTTEDPRFAPDPKPPLISSVGQPLKIDFRRPSAVILRAWPVDRA